MWDNIKHTQIASVGMRSGKYPFCDEATLLFNSKLNSVESASGNISADVR